MERPTYQYYENRVWNKAKIHLSNCSFCNYGQGIHSDASTENGWWSDEYSSLDDAYRAAFETGRNVSECKRCMTMELVA